MNYTKLNESLSGRCATRRKLGNNTFAERRDTGAIAIRLHSTDVLTFKADGSIVFNTGGWKTLTTKDRLNEYGPVRIWQNKGQWYFTHNGKPYVFADGLTITADGQVIGAATESSQEEQKQLRKRIAKYAKLCADKTPMQPPSAGDCWYCALRAQNGETWGEGSKDTSHLESHMKEGYVVPSLVNRALEFSGYNPQRQIIHAIAFGQAGEAGSMADIAKDAVKKSVRKYMLRQFGL